MEHSSIPSGEIHTPYQWIVQDDAARAAITPEFGDLHKLCLQLNTDTEWRLASLSPVRWALRSDAISVVSGANVGGHRIVVVDESGRAQYASCLNASSAPRVLGLTLCAASENDLLSVQRAGQVEEGSWSWEVGRPVYLGVDGLMTQVEPTYPSSSFVLIVGFPITATKLFVSLREPIILGA